MTHNNQCVQEFRAEFKKKLGYEPELTDVFCQMLLHFYKAGRAAERAEIREKLESEGVVDVVSDVIDDIADRNLALDANGKPILYNAVGITEAAITKILEVI